MIRDRSVMTWLRPAAIASAFVLLCAVSFDALAACKPSRPRPPIVLKSMGPCGFDPETLSYAGEPEQQAMCLVRPVLKLGIPGPPLESLPSVLANRVGRSSDLPARETLSGFLSKLDLERDFAAYLWLPVSRARDNDPNAPLARYFVLHDTSGPNFGSRAWPRTIDEDPKINNLAGHRCSDGWETAHIIVNRMGGMLLGHDFAIPWRATKFERGTRFAGALKGLFLHIEMIQPRRREGRRRDGAAPTPGFSSAQYDQLALLYVIASVRAERWLIPAFHAWIDMDIRDGHDDPQNFELEVFANSLEKLLSRLENPEETRVRAVH